MSFRSVCLLSLIYLGFLSQPVLASELPTGGEAALPESFFGYDAHSEIEILYDDLTFLLKHHVLNTASTERLKATRTSAAVGTRLKNRRSVLTALEGNKFFYQPFAKDDIRQKFLYSIRRSLEGLPDELSLDKLNRREQLAYWLNLYNVAVLEQLTSDPKKHLKRKIMGDESILEEKFLEVAGVPLSLNDIHYRILARIFADEPLVIYGLYQGYIGSPSIRKRAFTGRNVFHALEQNAVEFINSNRGTYSRGGNFRVSSFYERNRAFFPDFQNDLKKHINQYIRSPYWEKLHEADKLQPDINDWTITSLLGDNRDYGASVATNQAALFDSYIVGGGGALAINGAASLQSIVARSTPFGKYSTAEAEMLKKLNTARLKNTGTVTIEEIDREDLDQQTETEQVD